MSVGSYYGLFHHHLIVRGRFIIIELKVCFDLVCARVPWFLLEYSNVNHNFNLDCREISGFFLKFSHPKVGLRMDNWITEAIL